MGEENLFRDQVALITGAASGIGRETALRYAARGGAVVGLDLSQDALDQVGAEIGPQFLGLTCDVSDERQVGAAAHRIAQTHGRIDFLANVAGVAKYGMGPEDMTEEDFYFHYDVLVKGPMLVVKHMAPLLRQARSPSLVNVSSNVARIEVSRHFLYSSAKSAVEKYTRHLVRDLPGIRCNAVLPGFVDTPMWTRHTGFSEQAVQGVFDFIKTRIPCGRIGTCADIAECLLFLASGRASYINGASILVDGGYTHSPDWGL